MKPKLTDKDKLVLWGLTEYPDLKDNKISKKLGIKRRTFGAVKTKLKNNGVFSTLIFPDFNALGCEILTVCYGTFNPLTTFEDRKKDAQNIIECEEILHAYSTDREFFAMSVSKNFTDFRKKAFEIVRTYKQKNFFENVTHVHFPLEISRYWFFEFSELIKMLFGFDAESERKDENALKRVRLTKKEKKVLYSLVGMPDAKNIDIAHRTGIAMHTVGKIKKNLLEMGVIKIRKIPDLEMLDCEVLACIHVKYKSDKRTGYEHQAAEILRIDSDSEMVSLSLFKNYTAYKDYYDRKLEYLRSNDLIDEDPVVMLFPVEKLNAFKYFSFAPLVKKVLEVDAEF